MVDTTLRIVHTSDWHVGHELYCHGREAEHDAFLSWLIGTLKATRADMLLVTGDIYDVANPPTAAMARVYGFIRTALTECPHLTIAMIGGNHDSAARINLPGALLEAGRVHLIGQLPRCDGVIEMDRLLVPARRSDGTVGAWVVAVPYCRPGDLGQGNLADLYRNVIESAHALADGLPLVVTGHLHLAGGDVSPNSERRIVVGGEEAEPSSLFDERVAYVALGHLHRPQQVEGATLIRYAGSPIPMSMAERDYRHSITLVEIADGSVSASEIEVPRLARFESLPRDGARPIAEVEAVLREYDPPMGGEPPFVEVCILMDSPEPGIAARVHAALQEKAVRLAGIKSVLPDHAQRGAIAATVQELEEIDPVGVLRELHMRRHGAEPAADLTAAFERLLVEVAEAEAEA